MNVPPPPQPTALAGDTPEALTLDNCDREPIHIPGSIQPHGALLALDRLGRLTHASENVPALLGVVPTLGALLQPQLFQDQGVTQHAVFQTLMAMLRQERAARAMTARLNGRDFDVVLHRGGERLICEFEPREEGANITDFAHLALNWLEELKRSTDIQRLLDTAVVAVRELTGFDRVMAYRFAQDDSGEIVAEDKIPELDAFLGRRYPASDIPAQARRLYVLNTLRLIADVAYRPEPIRAAPLESEPLDLSHSVLRSVSPIHVEYLTNMGVHGSMSVSIVIGGKLWGMVACHHMARKVVPYPVRMAIDVIAQIIAASVQSLTAQEREVAVARAAWVGTESAGAIASGMEMDELILRDREILKTTLTADALLLTLDGVARPLEDVDPHWAQALTVWLETQGTDLVHVVDSKQLPAWQDDVPAAQRFYGVLAMRFDAPRQGWVVALRRERLQTIRWGGKPDKVIAHGPLGPRLTPRGSFEEWRETVRGTASPWSPIQLEIASQLKEMIERAYAARLVQQDAIRAQVWAILGHDLRNPLQSINMANKAIAQGVDAERLNVVIRNSTLRMNRLVSDVLDLSRLQNGHPLSITLHPMDLAELLRQLVEELATAHPTFRATVTLPDTLPMRGDPGRLAQLFSNLFSNARHHGHGDVTIKAHVEGDRAVVSVCNPGAPIPEHIAATLFDPFKRASMQNARNRTGMGLGLYISAQVVQGHGGRLRHVPGEGVVTFVVELPLALDIGEQDV